MKNPTIFLIVNLIFILPAAVFAQSNPDTTVSLKQCIEFALRNQPAVRQASIDQQINERDIRIGLSGWLPQINSSGQYQYYFKGSPVATTGSAALPATNLNQFSSLGLQASQVIYNNDVLQAAHAAKYSRQY